MSVTFETNIYAATGTGKKICIGKTQDTIADAHLVGGKIFYIDSTASGATYTFYDSTGEVLTDVRVGDEPYAYSVSGTASADKYYVFYNALATSKRWTYYTDGAYVYNSLDTAQTIGSGKTNTSTVMAADSGAYVTADSNGYPTAWYQIKLLRDGNIGGCNDWFLPSKNELEALRTATDRDGNALVAWFTNNHVWSSSEYSDTDTWRWNCTNQAWNAKNKSNTYGVVGARAF